MSSILSMLWLIPALPLAAAAVIALLPRGFRTAAATGSIGSLALSFLLSCVALAAAVAAPGQPQVHNFNWLEFGASHLQFGWVLDPLSAVMLVMVTFVGTLIFIYSVGYMAHDENFTRFFCFLSLFAAAMLGVIISNNLLLLFGCWELVGLASYLLIGFWYHKPEAAAAAKKAFITTRIGDMGFLLGMLWLYSETGTLLFYDHGAGCLESGAVATLVGKTLAGGMVLSTAISLLIFCGAVGKSGQVPLHVWLPDAMEGPTPVSALIHAATMVAAGVFLMARVYPIVAATPTAGSVSFALQAMAWTGGITALFAALIAAAQTDIKRILAYSTVSQLGFMFLGLATGGVAVGMFHLMTHAFFKALLFLGAGSVIHACGGEQDIRKMGGLGKKMPITFATYAVGMMALSGVPFLFSGFWSKDEILHAAVLWGPTKWPFVLAASAAVLTAFYMMRQVVYVFFGSYRAAEVPPSVVSEVSSASLGLTEVHESPWVMTFPLSLLAVGTVLLGVLGTPVWPWFHAFLSGHAAEFNPTVSLGVLLVMLFSIGLVTLGFGLAWRVYRREPIHSAFELDPLERWKPDWFAVLRGRFFIDELYEISFIRWHAGCARFGDWLDRQVWAGVSRSVSLALLALAWVGRLMDEFAVNLGFDQACEGVRSSSRWLSWLHTGQIQTYLRALSLGLAVLAFYLIWK